MKKYKQFVMHKYIPSMFLYFKRTKVSEIIK